METFLESDIAFFCNSEFSNTGSLKSSGYHFGHYLLREPIVEASLKGSDPNQESS